MNPHSAARLSKSSLKQQLAAITARDRSTTADMLVLIAEFDSRKLYRDEGYPSMYAYCVGELRMSEDIAYKRIRVARGARRFPAVLTGVAHGRLNLSSVVLLAPYLTEATAAELLAAAESKRRVEVEQLLASRFPQPDLMFRLEAIEPSDASAEFRQLAPGPVAGNAGLGVGATPNLKATADTRPEPTAIAPQPTPGGEHARLKPLAPERFALQVTIGQATHDKLRYAQDLLGHQISSGDVAEVLDRALEALIRQLEKQKFAATDQPRPPQSQSSDSRNIPAHVKRAVRKRDQNQCTFVSEAGHRCEAARGLEFDHVREFARGGDASVSGIRLRCRAHNQYEAECTYGAEFMRHKRSAAAERRIAKRATG